tara:strand:- start:2460 stop:2747 length:288 start_codon:yes stop_codon:yes gene_type:complete
MTTELITLRDSIEKMEKIHQMHVFKILKKSNIEYTENSNGIFFNITMLENNHIKEIVSYMDYVTLQQKQLNKIEDDKERYKKEFYKDNKAISSYT